jgi:undecaprenyl-diphosphatase
MPIWVAIVLGAVQGLAEFLPISSSGHLTLMQAIIDFEKYNVNAVAFDLVLHLGTLVAVVIAFWSDIRTLFLSFFGWVGDGFKVKNIPSRRLIVLILIATLPLVVGALIEGYVEDAFHSTLFVGIALCFTAVMLWIAAKHGGGKKTEADAKYSDAVKVGLMQLIALFPGVSRSGSTICGGLFSGFHKDFAVRFGFLMSIPAVLGAVVLDVADALAEGIDPALLGVYVVGIVSSAVSGYLSIRFINMIASKGKFGAFAYYCWAAGIITLILTFVL